MTTNFNDQELSWLKAAKRSFVLEPITKTFDKDFFIENLKVVLASVSDEAKKNDLIDKISGMPTGEFWEFYWRDFA
jgi:hypothetical protein